jgi:hypothetical protein
MKISHIFQKALVCLFGLILVAYPAQAFAVGSVNSVSVSPKSSYNTPPKSEISVSSIYSQGIADAKGSVNGTCSISKLSSSSLSIAGITTSSASDPAVKITLQLQAYYDGAWHAMKGVSKSKSGTTVSLSQAYNVTSGYYYRTYAIHSISDGTSAYSFSGSILIN